MPAVAEVLSTVAPTPRSARLRSADLPGLRRFHGGCGSVRLPDDNVISYLWTCDTCGYGFVTKHSLKRFACN